MYIIYININTQNRIQIEEKSIFGVSIVYNNRILIKKKLQKDVHVMHIVILILINNKMQIIIIIIRQQRTDDDDDDGGLKTDIF